MRNEISALFMSIAVVLIVFIVSVADYNKTALGYNCTPIERALSQ